ncbi:hypothetical protein SAMN05421505_14914 [Sinosporangium album]|uniref:Helix-turn-helix domain-containing protein n=1 Tax=Sinosporangium album TaxID=504805 RepID=A0A1G8KB79_9ACTN|nr:hypothetical protein [Sinosporangium album]SDI40643.1 hypothetical protein SAMN05421505_14914 [Sinosporangium album]
MHSSEPITINQAAERLGRLPRTVRTWASRYRARRLLKHGHLAWYDWHDLATIARQIHLGLPVPTSAEARDQLKQEGPRSAGFSHMRDSR